MAGKDPALIHVFHFADQVDEVLSALWVFRCLARCHTLESRQRMVYPIFIVAPHGFLEVGLYLSRRLRKFILFVSGSFGASAPGLLEDFLTLFDLLASNFEQSHLLQQIARARDPLSRIALQVQFVPRQDDSAQQDSLFSSTTPPGKFSSLVPGVRKFLKLWMSP
jgi:hypothetical protein